MATTYLQINWPKIYSGDLQKLNSDKRNQKGESESLPGPASSFISLWEHIFLPFLSLYLLFQLLPYISAYNNNVKWNNPPHWCAAAAATARRPVERVSSSLLLEAAATIMTLFRMIWQSWYSRSTMI